MYSNEQENILKKSNERIQDETRRNKNDPLTGELDDFWLSVRSLSVILSGIVCVYRRNARL